ncbi:DUF202 domain-containing protein [Nocardia panacis]|uniref:DUF202 domain-containing protein n=1 Tax=Nocardia panacis TaxID=2340916 RepID=A0A3A4KA42_9NOCA|nr:DUF202 domain-containing protein [Nocardia panacis]RJO74875.1 DUF202 domain-containing protein [Nocardia panacis]
MHPNETPTQGLATERTALAWRRTAVAAMVVAALFAQHALVSGWRPAQFAPLGASCAMLALAGLCVLRNRGLRRGRFHHGARVVTGTAVAVLVADAVAVVVALTYPGT